jgi:type IV pilus assembly protein PilP
MTSPAIRRVTYLFVGLSLIACGDDSVQEIKEWMDQTKKEAKVVVPKIAEPKKFTPFIYDSQNAIDPYNPTKLEVALAKAQGRPSDSAFKPDLNRRREPLESYPLDTVKMVGTLSRQGLSYALLQADKTVYQAKIGNYVGPNFGMITSISENEVELKEIVQDAVGEWIERKARLELQESTK